MMRTGVGAALRWIAIIIAVLAVIDPVFTISRPGRPLVAVVAAGGAADSAAAVRVMASLRSGATVVNGAFGGADATVIVGESLPDAAMESAAPVFAVTPSGPLPPAIEAVAAPATVSLDGAVAVRAVVRGGAGQPVDVALLSDGIEVDRKVVPASNGFTRGAVTLTAVPPDTGVQRLRVVASAPGSPSTVADVVVEVRSRRWAVLAYDAHPSWSSRFVRMALERDPRFRVSGRMVTSRAFASDVGAAPARLDDAEALRGYDAIVIGAPGDLNDAAVRGIERYMKIRGGAVILLMDEVPAPGNAALARLVGAPSWTVRGAPDAFRVMSTRWQGRRLRASQVAVPSALPPGASIVAEARAVASVEPVRAASSAPRRAVADTAPAIAVWSRPVGAGHLVVSGALDAWQHRDSASSNFDRVWQDLVADAAARALEPVAVSVPASVAPGAGLSVRMTLRDVAVPGADAASPHASVSAAIVSSTGQRTAVRLWPGSSIGEFEATVPAPLEPGTYRLDAGTLSERGAAPFVVTPDPAAATGPRRAALRPWVEGNGGRRFDEAELGTLPEAIRRAISFAPSPEPWHPMRSAWWIVPFALLLSAEWYLRRRRGLA